MCIAVSRRCAPLRAISRQFSFLNMFGISCDNLQQLDLVDIAAANEREVGRLHHHFWMLAIGAYLVMLHLFKHINAL